jgi:pentapeptide repeat protein
VRSGKLSGTLAVAAKSPWVWLIAPLAVVAALGQWRGVAAAEVVAALFGSVVIGIAIGLTLAGARHTPRAESEAGQPKTRPHSGTLAERDSGMPRTNSPRTADLRGAQLTNTTLVRANLRQADMRGAILRGADLRGADLSGADLTDADLTDAQVGPLTDNSPGN